MSKRMITVKGKGNVSSRPDLVIISLDIESKNYEYEKAMDIASESIQSLASKVESLGFERKDLKTASFDVDTDYQSYKDTDNNYQSRFVGYVVRQKLKLTFDFDSETLGRVLSGISETSADPELSIGFSVKDQTGLEEKLLIDAAESAKRRAVTLTNASGSKLGELLSIDYDWSELHLYSDVQIESSMHFSKVAMPEIEPEDLEVSDTVTFVWEIK